MQHWGQFDLERHVQAIWGRLAYLTRYGNCTLVEALDLDLKSVAAYSKALNAIVGEENKKK